MSKLVVNTIEAQTYKYDSDTTAISIDSTGRVSTPNNPAWRVQATTAVTFTQTGVTIPIQFINTDAVRNNFLQGGCTLGGSPNYLITVPVAGIYLVSLVMRIDGMGSGYIVGRIEKNQDQTTSAETSIISGNGLSTNYEGMTGSVVFKANAGDTFGSTIFSSNDASFTISGSTEFSGCLIG